MPQLSHCFTPPVPNDGAVVTIIPSAVTVTENEGTVNVRILRVGNSTQAITLNFYTVQNSSAPGTPIGMYIIISGLFLWISYPKYN